MGLKRKTLGHLNDGQRFKLTTTGFTGVLIRKSMGSAFVQFDEQKDLFDVFALSANRKTYIALGTEVVELEGDNV